ncbi:putative transcriptional regulatory protein pdtaR [Rubripirellula lacrimiformis]|uniref:Putative transcriptional regulatory protein pdtaR n=1 Tax=Rubripirellula lacrimiformis TaxID=1930273 RepID=A0A517N968_9BACT|nr:response regulator [Rubripirellula lacrimiformis]QDT03671.1 putative transcriptional regulatory protein pdtaR [Rubripirellula lacrimiformis]
MTGRLRIVIADDELDIRDGFRRLLGKLGCNVVGEAASGAELVELCRTELPDVVITDIRMPELSGLDAAKQIRQTQTIPIIVVSARERPTEQDSEFIQAFLTKPVSGPDLDAAIKNVVAAPL